MKLAQIRQWRGYYEERICADIDQVRSVLIANGLHLPHHEFEQIIIEQEGLLQEFSG